jgi:hypothetical protein
LPAEFPLLVVRRSLTFKFPHSNQAVEVNKRGIERERERERWRERERGRGKRERLESKSSQRNSDSERGELEKKIRRELT